MAEQSSIHSPRPRVDPHSPPTSRAVASGGYGGLKPCFTESILKISLETFMKTTIVTNQNHHLPQCGCADPPSQSHATGIMSLAAFALALN
jgi:hypothetical protein